MLDRLILINLQENQATSGKILNSILMMLIVVNLFQLRIAFGLEFQEPIFIIQIQEKIWLFSEQFLSKI